VRGGNLPPRTPFYINQTMEVSDERGHHRRARPFFYTYQTMEAPDE